MPLAPVPDRATGAAVPEPHRLDVYRVALEFHSIATNLLPRRGFAELRDQLHRASTSIALNIAEGSGRLAPADKARFYVIARGSTTECVAILDLVEASVAALPERVDRRRVLLIRIIQMLTKLVARYTATRGAP